MNALRELLAKNYAAIGWALVTLDARASDMATSETVLTGQLLCPCGGREYFNLVIGTNLMLERPADIAESILTQTASRAHLQADVDAGILPAMDVDKHTFKGELLR